MNDARIEKQKVLAVASKLFGRRGYPNVSLGDVAEGAGLDRQGLARYCLSKEDLLFQVLRREVSTLVEEAEQAIEPDLPADRLLSQLSMEAFSLEDKRPLLKALMLGRLEEHVPTWKDRLHELRQRCLQVPIQLLQRGIEAGVMRRDLPVDLLAQFLFELHAMGLFRTEKRGGEAGKQRRLVAIEIVLRGMRARGAPPGQPPRAPAGAQAPRPQPFAALPGLLEASRRVLAAQGFKGFTLDRAAMGAAMSTDELTSHFALAEDLLLALLTEEVEEIVTGIQARVSGPGHTQERLRGISEVAFQFLQERPLLVQLFRGDAAAALPGKEAELQLLMGRLESAALPVLSDGVARGEVRADLPVGEMSSLLLEVHMAGYLMHYQPGPDLHLRAMQRRVAALDFLMDGLLMP